MKINLKSIQDHIYLFLLLCYSGNPFFFKPDASKLIFSIFVVLFLIRHYKNFTIPKSKHLYVLITFFSLLFALQFSVLGFISIPGVLGFLLKLVFGYIIIATIGNNFSYIYFNTIFFISLISLFGYLWNLAGLDIPSIYDVEDVSKSIIIFTQKGDGMRNSGMFWEPGVLACYITFGFLLYIGNIHTLFKIQKTKFIIVLMALATTFSTTGYIVFFFLIIINFFLILSWKNIVLILPMIVTFTFAGLKIYDKSEFLKEKITRQYEATLVREGEFSPDRFGAFMFDLYYIKKHPLIGNGIHEKTRYADHGGVESGITKHGNGFSNFLASMGFLGLFIYSYYILKYRLHNKWIFLMMIFLILQGEPLMNFPLFLTIPFIFLFNENSRISYNLPQQVQKNTRLHQSTF